MGGARFEWRFGVGVSLMVLLRRWHSGIGGELSEVSYLFLFQYSVTYSFSLPYSQLLPYSKTGLKGLIFLMMTHKNSLFSQ